MRFGIRSKLFLASLGLIAASLATADLYLTRALDQLLSGRIEDDLFIRCGMIARDASTVRDRGAGGAAGAVWDSLADELGRRARARVTLVRRDGAVLGDSEVDASGLTLLESHADRPEVVGALREGSGASVRYSRTLRQRMMYVAVPFSTPDTISGVARVAVPLTEVDTAISQLRRVLIAGSLVALLVAILMSSAAALISSKRVRRVTETARRMAGGDLHARTRTAGGDEIAALGKVLDLLAESLSKSMGDLRSERDLLGGILEGMQEGVLVLGPGDRVLLVNPALREMLLLPAGTTGKSLLEAIRNSELKEILERTRAGATGNAGGAEAAHEINLSGLKPRRLLVRAAPLPDTPGGMVAVFVDVTRIRRLESLRRDFVANVSHELRTPVTSIRSAAETLRSALGDPDAMARFVEIIDRNAERLHRLVEDVLDLSRIESRELRLHPEPIEVGAFAEQLFTLYRGRAESRGIRFGLEISEGTLSVRADRRALEQVLGNLIDNAVKYCGDGAEIAVRASPAGAGVVAVSVVDTGPGIEPKHLPRLFERFYRVDAGRSRELGGTGLGLAIVKHLVEAMGGRVRVESVFGEGTTFTLTLPSA